MKNGFMYLCAIIDIHTRFVVGWGISNSMTAAWCCEIVSDAITRHGKPELINSDQVASSLAKINRDKTVRVKF